MHARPSRNSGLCYIREKCKRRTAAILSPRAAEPLLIEPDGINYRRDQVFFRRKIFNFLSNFERGANISKYAILSKIRNKRLIKRAIYSARKKNKINLYIKLNIKNLIRYSPIDSPN
jgi:hypothetical protein